MIRKIVGLGYLLDAIIVTTGFATIFEPPAVEPLAINYAGYEPRYAIVS